MSNYTPEVYIDYELLMAESEKVSEEQNNIRIMYMVGYLVICTLGLALNSVIIIAECRQYHWGKKSKEGVWVLALAVTHLLHSVFLVLQLLYAWNHFNWHYGTALCKLSSYVSYCCMFSTAAMLSLWSVSHSISTRWPRCFGHSSIMTVMVLGSWSFGAILAIPSLLSRELRDTVVGRQCIDDYDLNKEKTTDAGMARQQAVVLSRFLLGVLLPALVMGVSSWLTRRRSYCEQKIFCALRVAYLVCWTPLLLLGLVQFNSGDANYLKYGLPGATVLAAAYSYISPMICLLMCWTRTTYE